MEGTIQNNTPNSSSSDSDSTSPRLFNFGIFEDLTKPKPANGLRLTDEEIRRWFPKSSTEILKLRGTYQDLPIVSKEQEEFRYKLSLLLFEIFEEINQHHESWKKCNKFVEDFEVDTNFKFQKF